MTRVHNTVETGIVCTIVPTSQSHDGNVVKIEGKFYELTTTPECSEDRTAVPSVVKTKLSFVYTHVSMLYTLPHTHLKDCKDE